MVYTVIIIWYSRNISKRFQNSCTGISNLFHSYGYRTTLSKESRAEQYDVPSVEKWLAVIDFITNIIGASHLDLHTFLGSSGSLYVLSKASKS